MKIIIENEFYESVEFLAVEGESIDSVKAELQEAISSGSSHKILFRGRSIMSDFQFKNLEVYSLDEFWERNRI